jgi:selenoprotein W-related protein
VGEVSLIPSSGGVFEVKANDRLVFSKKSLGRFPQVGEVESKISEISPAR